MQTLHHTVRTLPIDLSGAPAYESLYTSENTTEVRDIKIVYDESTSADAGVEIRVGKIGSPSFFATFTTQASMTAGKYTHAERTNTVLLGNETLTVECDGGKTGSGVVSVQIELNHALTL